MNSVAIANDYLSAWNSHSAQSIVDLFSKDGSYSDPATGEISGSAIGEYARGIWASFPDLSFELVGITEAGKDKAVAEWLMKGTNSGEFQGLPPTGKSISLSGVDIIEVTDSKIKRVKGYFDTQVIPKQLGLQVLIQSAQIGPFSFGNSVCVQTGKKTKPGAFAITSLWNSEEQIEEIRHLTQKTATEMLSMDGFIGASFMRIGTRGITVSAWESPQDTKQLMQGGTHSEAMRKFWSELSDAGFTSVWTPDHINPLWVRCGACQKMNDYEKSSGVCSCGSSLPDSPGYF